MNRRQTEGAETIARLRDWTRGQSASERLAAHLLRIEGYRAVDPSHPLGGPDGLKDVVCEMNGRKWIGAAYFPRGQQSIGAIRDKFRADLDGARANGAGGLAFVTNQELRISERSELVQLGATTEVDVLHLERTASILDAPACYGIRLEYLDIEMTKEEQLAFFSTRDAVIESLKASIDLLMEKFQGLGQHGITPEGNVSVPLAEIREFKSILDSIAGSTQYGFSYLSSLAAGGPAHISNIRVPLEELREFANILNKIAGSSSLSHSMTISTFIGGAMPGHVSGLRVPLSELKEYEATLDRIVAKKRLLPDD
jgi:hypothetical protein